MLLTPFSCRAVCLTLTKRIKKKNKLIFNNLTNNFISPTKELRLFFVETLKYFVACLIVI